MKRFPRDDAGNATVVAAGIIASLAALCFLLAAVGGALLNAHQARLAADLAAVAGAVAHNYGDDGCAAARQVAELNRAELVACHPEDMDIVLTARVKGKEVTARAGPL